MTVEMDVAMFRQIQSKRPEKELRVMIIRDDDGSRKLQARIPFQLDLQSCFSGSQRLLREQPVLQSPRFAQSPPAQPLLNLGRTNELNANMLAEDLADDIKETRASVVEVQHILLHYDHFSPNTSAAGVATAKVVADLPDRFHGCDSVNGNYLWKRRLLLTVFKAE
eukprot:TRINITY_DN1301_c0_g1_i1.p3 TRINITY_DN1301_c0_g1~~TRINITY_DN1301_c0_g1_i1.p3  ORF type:complete len:166 (+),score=11.45 TRINITY_DN1301_c0_g1_i1:2574-3071(+)